MRSWKDRVSRKPTEHPRTNKTDGRARERETNIHKETEAKGKERDIDRESEK